MPRKLANKGPFLHVGDPLSQVQRWLDESSYLVLVCSKLFLRLKQFLRPSCGRFKLQRILIFDRIIYGFQIQLLRSYFN